MFLHRVYSGSSLFFFFNSLIITYQTATTVLFNLFSPRNFAVKYFLRVVKPFSGQILATKSKRCPELCSFIDHFASLSDTCKT